MFHKKKYDYDLLVIGSGAGGGVGAIAAASMGKRVAMFEKGVMGGECPSFACIPTKALLHAAEVLETTKNAHDFGVQAGKISFNFEDVHKRKNLVVSRTGATHGEEVFKSSGVHIIKEEAKFISPHVVEAGGKVYSSDKFLIATGSSVFVPDVPGLHEAGYLTFKQAVNLVTPPESLLILGGGAVACEFAQIFSTFGTKVTLLVRSNILSNEDPEVIALVAALFENRGIDIVTDSSITKVDKSGSKKEVFYTNKNHEKSIIVEEILIATGKVPVLNFAPEKAGIQLSHHGVTVNKYLQTSVSNIYAAGDIVGPYLFTHTGYYQSSIAIKNMFSRKKVAVNYTTVPRCIFLTPEVASVGMSESVAKEKGIKVKKGLTPIGVLGRANATDEFDGFVKVLTDSKGIIIGSSIVAPRAGEMIHELALAVHLKVKAQTIAEMIHAYPTFSEAVKIACSNVE